MAELTQTEVWEVTTADVDGGGKKLTFGGNWKSIFYAVPTDVDMSKVTGITFHVTSGNADKFAYKTFTEADYANKASTQTQVNYGNNVMIPDTATRASIKYLAITSNFTSGQDATPIEMEITSISFTISGIEEDIPDWKDSITRDLGSDAIAGTCIVQGSLSDQLLMDLTTKHFNAITFENKMKPDAILGSGTTQEVTFNGETLAVPVLDFSRADSMLAYIKAWNDKHM